MTGEVLRSLQPSWAITHSSPDFSQKSEVNDGNELWAIMFMLKWNASIFSRSGANILHLVSTHEYELLGWKLHFAPPKKKLQNKTITHRKRKHESHTSQVGIHLPLISLLILRMSCTACGGEKKTERSHKFGWRRECLHHPRDGIKWCFRHRVVWFWVHFTCFYFCSNPVSGQLP